MFGLRRFVKEELTACRALLGRNQSVWAEFDGLRKSNPNSAVLKYPLTLEARPYVGTPVAPEDRAELDIQDRLRHYLEALDKADQMYDWSGAAPNQLPLLFAWRKRQRVREQELFEGFAEHDKQLKWLAGRRTLQDIERRLRCRDAARKRPCP